jgi:hypothetical protein
VITIESVLRINLFFEYCSSTELNVPLLVLTRDGRLGNTAVMKLD